MRVTLGNAGVTFATRSLRRRMVSAGRRMEAELGNTSQTITGKAGLWARMASRMRRMLDAIVSGVAFSSMSLVPMRRTTPMGARSRTSCWSRARTPREVSPLMPRFASLSPGKASWRRPPQPSVIESPTNTRAWRSASRRASQPSRRWSQCFWNHSARRMGPSPGRPSSDGGTRRSAASRELRRAAMDARSAAARGRIGTVFILRGGAVLGGVEVGARV